MNKRRVGTAAESRAAAFLSEKGVHIVEKNFRNRHGEIDVIGYHGDYLVFFEVKYRKSSTCGNPEAAVDFYKQKKICQVAAYYRCIHRISWKTPIRYDVVAIEGEKIRWYQNAFEHRD